MPGISHRRIRKASDDTTPSKLICPSDAETFQRLLAAAHILQECKDDHRQESKAVYLGLSDVTIAHNAQPVQVVRLTPQPGKVPVPDPPVQRAVPSRIAGRRISQGKEFFWCFPTVFAVAAILFLLVGASVHLLSPLPSGRRPSFEMAQQQTPLQRTTAKESLATTPVEPPDLLVQPSVRGENSGSPTKRIVKSHPLHSTFGSAAHLIAENTRVSSEVESRIRTDRRLQMTQVQVRASNGIVTLLGNVGSDAQRVAAAQDAARVRGVEALVNNLRVIRQSPTGALQRPRQGWSSTPPTSWRPQE